MKSKSSRTECLQLAKLAKKSLHILRNFSRLNVAFEKSQVVLMGTEKIADLNSTIRKQISTYKEWWKNDFEVASDLLSFLSLHMPSPFFVKIEMDKARKVRLKILEKLSSSAIKLYHRIKNSDRIPKDFATIGRKPYELLFKFRKKQLRLLTALLSRI